MSIPANFIDELLARTDIVALINRYIPTPLKRSGRSYMACCPFHDEKTPSFSVTPDKGLYYCFGCHASGGAIKFLMEHQRMAFHEAVEELAHQAGMEVPRQNLRTSTDAQKRLEKMNTIMNKVSEFYRVQLKQNTQASDYLKRRGITQEITADFAIGYAPAKPCLKQCLGSAYNEKMLNAVGLIAQSGGRSYEKFRNRLMFPIRNRRGNVIAFGGRLLDNQKEGQDHSPKYMNSPETLLFKKRNTLYGMHELKKVRDLQCLLFVEGYMDAVSLAQHGVRNVVATLGTATSQTHIRMALRFSSNLIFCFDGDDAGRRAAVEAAQQALSAFTDGCSINFMFLPSGEDPDSYVQQHGYQEFNKQISAAVPLADFLFEHHSQGLDLNNPAHATRYAKTLRPLIMQLPQGMFRELMFNRLAERTQIDVSTLKIDYEASKTPVRTRGDDRSKREILYSTVTVALRLLLEKPSLVERTLAAGEIRTLQKPGAELLADVVDCIRHKQLSNTASIIESFRESPHQENLSRLLATPSPPAADTEIEFKDTMRQLEIEITEQRIGQLQKELLTNDSGQMEINNLLKRLHALKSEPSSVM